MCPSAPDRPHVDVCLGFSCECCLYMPFGACTLSNFFQVHYTMPHMVILR